MTQTWVSKGGAEGEQREGNIKTLEGVGESIQEETTVGRKGKRKNMGWRMTRARKQEGERKATETRGISRGKWARRDGSQAQDNPRMGTNQPSQ